MKKIILALTLLSALAGRAQDTLSESQWEKYFYNTLPNLKEHNAIMGGPITGDTCGILCKRLVSEDKDSLKIYGVAAGMITPLDKLYLPPDADSADVANYWEVVFSNYSDTSLVNAYEYVGIYLRNGDSLDVQQQKRIHRMYDTPSYFVRPDPTVDVYGGFGRNPDFVYPMYEKYFDSMIAVADTFYVGVTQRSQEGANYSTWNHIGLSVVAYYGLAYNRDYTVFKYCYPREGQVYWSWESFGANYQEPCYLVMFPILTPEGDTTAVGGDTTAAVTSADMVSRYVNVHPNPAVDEVRVLSSFGLTHIEAFDAGGRQLATLPATGYEATLDIASWPRGTYLLRITTPLGPVTKKLLVR